MGKRFFDEIKKSFTHPYKRNARSAISVIAYDLAIIEAINRKVSFETTNRMRICNAQSNNRIGIISLCDSVASDSLNNSFRTIGRDMSESRLKIRQQCTDRLYSSWFQLRLPDHRSEWKHDLEGYERPGALKGLDIQGPINVRRVD